MQRRVCAILMFLTFLLAGLPLSAQADEIIDSIVKKDNVLKLNQAAWLVLLGSGKIQEDADLGTAFKTLAEQPWGFEKASADLQVDAGVFSILVMKAFAIPGGLDWSMFAGGREALRELVFHGIAAGKLWPDKVINGQEAILIVQKAMKFKEAMK